MKDEVIFMTNPAIHLVKMQNGTMKIYSCLNA